MDRLFNILRVVPICILCVGLGYAWGSHRNKQEVMPKQTNVADSITKDFTLTIFNDDIVVYIPIDCVTQWVSSDEPRGLKGEFLIDPKDVVGFKAGDKIPIIVNVPEGALWVR